MNRFSIHQVVCERCGRLQDPESWSGRCPRCEHGSFRVEIERSASGWESYDLEDFIPRPVFIPQDDPKEPYWSSQSFVECGGVSGKEVMAFCSAPADQRHQMYIAWKRRELEGSLSPDQKVCGRCRVIFRAFPNPWNQEGYCSRSCWKAGSKSKRAAK